MNALTLAPCRLPLILLIALIVGCSGRAEEPSPPGPNGAGSGALIDEVITPTGSGWGDTGCVPDCSGKVCGFDGCFDQCGLCDAGQTCEGGQCVTYTCTPNCAGRVCGDDGCGGSCGACSDGEFCLSATGTCNVADPCEGVTFEGCCDGDLLTWCAAASLQTMECDGSCGWDSSIGEYNCGTEGGSDPSGTYSKACGGDCSCEGKSCGDDGCGNSCGVCTHSKVCVAGACVDDPCQGVTYEGCCQGEVAIWCSEGELVEYDCADEPVCGWVPELGYFCESDGGSDPSGTLPKACNLGDCTPNCGTAACGDDGCGGSCGACGDGETCTAGQCEATSEDPCEGYTPQGCCDGQTVIWCEDSAVWEYACGVDGGCGWDAATGAYDCGTDGGEAPGGEHPKACP